jgi:hypothetical protein
MAQRLEAALRRPARSDDIRARAGAAKTEPAPETFTTASPSPRLDTTLRRPLKADEGRAPSGATKSPSEPSTPAPDQAPAEKDARARGADTKPAKSSFYDSLEEEMASLLNRPPSKP